MASRSRSPDRRVPRSRDSAGAANRLRRAPCRWAAASPCDHSVRWRGCRWPSRSRSPDRRVPRSRERCCHLTACDEHLAVGQQRRRVTIACGGEAAGGRPGPARRIVEFRARESADCCQSACDEHLAVGQQRRRVTIACGGEAAGGRPGPARRIVEFRARESRRCHEPPATSTLPLGSSVAV